MLWVVGGAGIVVLEVCYSTLAEAVEAAAGGIHRPAMA